MKLEYQIYVVTDDFGNKNAVVACDESERLMVSGMKNPDGESVHFDSEVYHIKNWCEDNGLEYREIAMVADV